MHYQLATGYHCHPRVRFESVAAAAAANVRLRYTSATGARAACNSSAPRYEPPHHCHRLSPLSQIRDSSIRAGELRRSALRLRVGSRDISLKVTSVRRSSDRHDITSYSQAPPPPPHPHPPLPIFTSRSTDIARLVVTCKPPSLRVYIKLTSIGSISMMAAG